MTSPIGAVYHVRKMRGGSQAHLLHASDGEYYVTKFQGNPQHTRVLANEMFAARAGLALQLPMPQVEIIHVDESLIVRTPELCFESSSHTEKCPAGDHLGSRYVGDPLEHTCHDYLPESLQSRVTNLGDFARALVLDKWLGNSDGRQVVFRNNSENGYTATFVDQGYCFNAGDWDFPDSALRGVYPRNDVYAGVTGWESFEPALTLAEHCDISDLWRWARAIPGEWYGQRNDDLERLVETVHRRRHSIRKLIMEFRDSTREPFPNWTSR